MAITPWEMSKEPKEVLPSAGSRRPSNSGSVPLALNTPPIKSAEPPSWGGGSLCTPAVPLFPTSLLLWHQVICLFPWTPCQAGTDDWLLHFSVQHKDLHIQALGLCPLNSFTHVVTHLQIFIACSMPDTVLGVKQLS